MLFVHFKFIYPLQFQFGLTNSYYSMQQGKKTKSVEMIANSLSMEKSFGIIAFKTSLNDKKDFVNLALCRRWKFGKIINIPQTNTEYLPISKKKK